MPNFTGTRLMEGQAWSRRWAGMIDCGNGRIREPIEYKGRSHNRYYQETNCSHCSSLMLSCVNNYKKSKNSFCCQKCKSEYVKASSKGNKTLKKRPGGDHHVLVKNWDHPRADRHGLVYEHLIVAEKKLGRSISKKEVIHHINCIKEDNREENLYVCKDAKEHFLIHGSLNKCVARLIEIGALTFDSRRKKYEVVE